MRLATLITCVALTTATLATTAPAQDRERSERPDRDAMQARVKLIWQWQAKSVADRLDLNADQAARLQTLWTESRGQLRDAQRAARGQRGERGEGRQRGGEGRQRGGMRASPEAEAARADLEKQLGTFLSADQTTAAMATMGGSTRQWDRMVSAVIDLSLDDDATLAALAPVDTYVQRATAAWKAGERDAIRLAMTEARDALMDDMKTVLTEDQMVAFEERTTRRRGGQRGEGRQRGAQGGDASSAVALKIGEPAPDFTLTDSSGRAFSLSAYQGRTVVLQWINPECPVCERVSASGKVKSMVSALKKLDGDIVHLTVNSTHTMDGKTTAAYLTRHHVDAPGLIDRDGTVGRLYGARTTPHMYVIDDTGILRYQGAIDDDARGRKGTDAKNYVVNAVQQMVAGETVAPDTTRSYGCSVKYAK